MGYSGLSPKTANDYTNPKNGIVPAVTRDRRPTTADYRQPETGKNYPITCIWQVGKNPTTGSEGELWALSKIVANVATWVRLANGGATGLQSLTGDDSTVVEPDGAGNIDIVGSTVANATNSKPVYIDGTEADPVHKLEVEVQLATAVTATPGDSNDAGLACFNTAQFTVDATSGMVGLKGSGTSPPVLLLALDDSNNATADGSGVITLGGTAVTNGSNSTPLYSVRTPGSNDVDLQLQIGTAVDPASDTINDAGIASFNQNQFQVDATTGMVSMLGSTTDNAVLAINADTGSGGPDANGELDIIGAGGATTSITGNVLTVTAGATGGGLTWREETGTSANFSTNEGIFGNNASTITLTLPSGPSVGATFAAYQEGDGKVRVQAQGADIIKFGNQSCAAGGYIESLDAGGCVWIVAIDASRFRVINSVGSWTISA